MTTKKSKLVHGLLALAFTCTTSLVQAQPPDDPGLDPDPPQQIPFDGGISLIVAAGIAYAAKKGHDKRKKANRNEPADK